MESVHGIAVSGGSFPAEIWRLFMEPSLDAIEPTRVPGAFRMARPGSPSRAASTRSPTTRPTRPARRPRRRRRRRRSRRSRRSCRAGSPSVHAVRDLLTLRGSACLHPRAGEAAHLGARCSRACVRTSRRRARACARRPSAVPELGDGRIRGAREPRRRERSRSRRELRREAPRSAPLEPGSAAAIATGGAVPEGADTIVPVESATEEDGRVRIAERARAGRAHPSAGRRRA